MPKEKDQNPAGEAKANRGTVKIRLKRDNQVTPIDGTLRLAKAGDVVEVAPHEARHLELLGIAETVE